MGLHLAGDAHRADARFRRSACASSASGSGMRVAARRGALQGRSFALGRRRDWLHVIVAAMLNIVGFTMLSSFALLLAGTGRVAILVLHDADLGRVVRVARARRTADRARVLALALCVAGMAILISPLADDGHSDRPAARARDRHELGGRHRLPQMGAHRRRPGRGRGVAARRRRFSSSPSALPFVEGSPHLAQAHCPRCSGRSSPASSDRGLRISSGSRSSAGCRR